MDQLYSPQYFLVVIRNHPAINQLLPPQIAQDSDVIFLSIY